MTNRKETSRGALRRGQALIILTYCAVLGCLETGTALVVSETDAARYLSHFGYLSPITSGSEEIIYKREISAAISEFQSFTGITVTGKFDNETAREMNLPRCGIKDHVGPKTSERSRRFGFFGKSWPVERLTYRISKYPSKLNRTDVDEEISKAFALWSEFTDLTFSPGSEKGDIEIKFERGWHGDSFPFNGSESPNLPHNNVAHTSTPGRGIMVEVHFDDDEKWSIGGDEGINLLWVAAHEFGHALGLLHSSVRGSILFPIMHDKMVAKLNNNDIAGIQARYGPKTTDADPNICKDPNIDTILNSAEGYTYVFKGKHYWNLTADGKVAEGYPQLIATKWNSLPSNIDASFTDETGTTYFFKGSNCWKYVNDKLDDDFPKNINDSFPGIPDHIDAATGLRGSNQTWFSKGTEFWIFDPLQTPRVLNEYPKPISSIQGIPIKVDAVLNQKNYVFFFHGRRFYRQDKRSRWWDLEGPEETGSRLFGCPGVTDSTLTRFNMAMYGYLKSCINAVKYVMGLNGLKLGF